MLESEYQTHVHDELRHMFPGCMIQKMDSGYQQGVPDWLLLWGTRWALLEIKRSARARKQPNQPYFVDLFNDMSFAAFIYPENEEEVLDALQRAFRVRRSSRVSQRQ